jgi:hypothetical protein
MVKNRIAKNKLEKILQSCFAKVSLKTKEQTLVNFVEFVVVRLKVQFLNDYCCPVVVIFRQIDRIDRNETVGNLKLP